MATQTGTLKAGNQLVIDSQGASVDYDVSVTGCSVDFKRIQQENTLSLGPHKVDCSYSVTVNSGSPSIYKVQPNGQREYTADTLPDQATLAPGTPVVVDGVVSVGVGSRLLPLAGVAYCEYPIEQFIPAGEFIKTDGSADVGNYINTAFVALNALYVVDGIPRQVFFPTGKFKVTTQVIQKSGVGVVGVDLLSTTFEVHGSVSCFRGPITSIYYTDLHYQDFSVDCYNQTIASGGYFYQYKAFYLQKVRGATFKRIRALGTSGTAFGNDFLEEVEFTDCISIGAGRLNAGDRLSAGAGFGVAVGLSQNESCTFNNCISNNSYTHGYYIEFSPSNGATFNPTGIKLNNCTAKGNWIGIFDAGAMGLQVNGGEYSKNLFLGLATGINGASNKAGTRGRITGGALFTQNGQLGYYGGGIGFLNGSFGTEYDIGDAVITDNNGYGVVSVDGASINISSGARICNNGGSGVLIRSGKTTPRLSIDSSVQIARNGQGGFAYSDGITIEGPVSNPTIDARIYDDQTTKTQQKAIRFAGEYTSTGVRMAADARDAGGSGPVRIEQTLPSAVNNVLSDGSTGVAQTVTNLITNPSFELATSGTSLSNATGSRPTGMTPLYGAYIYRGTINGAGAVQINFDKLAVVADQVLTLSSYVRAVAGREVKAVFKDYDNASLYYSGLTMVATGAWQRVSFTFVIPEGCTNIRPAVWQLTGGAAGEFIDIDGLMVTEGSSLHPYFDGANGGGAWTGAANASTSTKSITF